MTKITIPDGVSFQDWILGLMQHWYPDRTEQSIKETVQSFYNWQQIWPDKDGNLAPHLMSQITNMAITYKSMDHIRN